MTSTNEQVNERLNALRQQFLRELGPRFDEIQAAWTEMEGQGASEDRVAALHRLTHMLAGSAAVFGHPTVGDVARAIEDVLAELRTRVQEAHDAKVPKDIVHRVRWLVDELREAADVSDVDSLSNTQIPVAYYSSRRGKRSVMILNEDRAQGAALGLGLREAGYQVRVLRNPQQLDAAFVVTPPDALIIGTSFASGFQTVFEHAARLCHGGEAATRLVVVSSKADLATRVMMRRLSADAFIAKSNDLWRVIPALDHLLFGESVARARILVVSPDANVATVLRRTLEARDVYVDVATDPETALRRIEEGIPELVIADLDMDTCSGIELASIAQPCGGRGGAAFRFFSRGDADRVRHELSPSDANRLLADIRDPEAVAERALELVESRRLASRTMDEDEQRRVSRLEETMRQEEGANIEVTVDALEEPDWPAGRRRVLVAEDDGLLAEAFRIALEADGYEVITVRDGLDALDVAQNEHVDFIVTDQLMPRCSGEGLIARLRASPHTSRIPVIMVTQHRFESGTDVALERDVVRRYKALAYLEKPVKPEVVAERVRAYFDSADRRR